MAFEGAIRLMNALGEPTRSAAVEGLLAEGLTTLLNRSELAPDLVNRIANTAPGTVSAAGGAATETDIGPELVLPSTEPTNPTKPPNIDPTIVDVGLLDLELRALSADLMCRDLRLAELDLLG